MPGTKMAEETNTLKPQCSPAPACLLGSLGLPGVATLEKKWDLFMVTPTINSPPWDMS